jgi:uncharacterized protein YegL
MNTKTYYQLILDRSGSMKDCMSETISGFNEQVQMIRSLEERFPEQEVRVSLTLFNQSVHHPIQMQPAGEIKDLNRETYVPDGMTALYDAIGEAVMSLKAQVETEVREEKASVVVVIITDGYENSSKLFGLRAIRHLIRELEDTGKWTFSFLGAGIDAMAEAEKINIRKSNAMRYAKQDSRKAHHELASNLANYMELKTQGKVKKNFLFDEENDKNDSK